MNPSIQCIFERTLAGIALVVSALLAALLLVWLIERTVTAAHRWYRKRWPVRIEKPRNHMVRLHWERVGIALVGGSFSGLALLACYFVGKKVLADLGICHLK